MDTQSTAKRLSSRRLFQVLLLSLLICLIGGGLALFAQVESGQRSQAIPADASVVGPPTLPAATVDAIFTSMGSPMVGTGKAVEQAARQANIDDAFALGVWWTETNDGEAGVGSADRNPGSVRGSAGFPVAFDGYTIYPSYTTAVYDWFNLLRTRYVDRGLTTVYAISYPYVGTSSSPLWAGKVVALMQRYHAEAPPPTPTVPPLDQVKRISHQTQKIPLTLLRRNHPYPRTVNGATVDLHTQNPELSPAASAQQGSPTAALSQGAKYGLVLFGLLAAFALALWGLALGGIGGARRHPVPTPAAVSPARATSPSLPPAFGMSTASLALPVTGTIPSTPRPAFAPAFNMAEWQELLPQPRTDALVPDLSTIPTIFAIPAIPAVPAISGNSSVPVTASSRTPIAPRVGLAARRGDFDGRPPGAGDPLPATGPSTTGLRRVVLRPSQTLVTATASRSSSGGLLSRYRESIS